MSVSATEAAAAILWLAVVGTAAVVAARPIGAWLLTREATGPGAAEAHLATAILALAIVLGAAHVLGAVGLFTWWAVMAAVVAVALVSRRVLRAPTAVEREREPWWALALPALAFAQWASHSFQRLHDGSANIETLRYHLSMSARFVQDGSIGSILHTSPEARIAFNPGESELLHALVVLPWESDAAAPLVNLGGLVLAAAAAFVLGRRWAGNGRGTLAATALLCLVPTLVLRNAGEANNDVLALAFLLAAVAFVAPGAGAGRLALAGTALGIAVAMKYTNLLPSLALCALVAWRYRRELAWFAIPLVATGSFWFLRNLLSAASPVPAADLGVFPVLRSTPALERLDVTFLSRLGDAGFLTEAVPAALGDTLGVAWPVLLAAAVAGTVMALADRRLRLLGLLAVAWLLAFLVTPQTGGALFANLRYGTPFLALGLCLLPMAAGSRQDAVAAGYLGLGLVVVVDTERVALASLTACGAALAATAVLVRRPRAAPAVAAVALIAAAALADGRWRGPMPGDVQGAVTTGEVTATYAWAHGIRDSRIGVVGFLPQSPLLGDDLSNRVEYVGRREERGNFARIETCEELMRAVRRYDYVVAAPDNFPFVRADDGVPEREWLPTAGTSVHRAGPVEAFRIERAGRCA